ncbi:MAG: N-acetyltransferase [Clostridia bacterium]|nr:N-acetyltransferase [Clostridia bacterium]
MQHFINKSINKSVAYDGNLKVGECDFTQENDEWNIVHTEVNNLYQGQGIARKLVETVIENSIRYNKKIKADCSYAKKVIEKTK